MEEVWEDVGSVAGAGRSSTGASLDFVPHKACVPCGLCCTSNTSRATSERTTPISRCSSTRFVGRRICGTNRTNRTNNASASCPRQAAQCANVAPACTHAPHSAAKQIPFAASTASLGPLQLLAGGACAVCLNDGGDKDGQGKNVPWPQAPKMDELS